MIRSNVIPLYRVYNQSDGTELRIKQTSWSILTYHHRFGCCVIMTAPDVLRCTRHASVRGGSPCAPQAMAASFPFFTTRPARTNSRPVRSGSDHDDLMLS